MDVSSCTQSIKSFIRCSFRHPCRFILSGSAVLGLFLFSIIASHSPQFGKGFFVKIRNANILSRDDVSPSYSATKNRTRKNHLVYVKIEKTGSSTLSNIFSSYGYRHHLNLMMSNKKKPYVDTRVEKPGVVWDVGPDRNHPHIMEQHAVLNEKLYSRMFPPDTVYLTSIRDPRKWFISYVDFMKAYKDHDPREVLLDDELFYMRRKFSVTGHKSHLHNNFLGWLNFDVEKNFNKTAIKEFIKKIDRKFTLVMLTEYFDESLVLLKRIMNWNLIDIFYSYANEAKKRSEVVFSSSETAKLLDQNHNYGDWTLYRHFNKTLWKRIRKQPGVLEEVKVFRALNVKAREFCFSKELQENKSLSYTMTTKWDGDITMTGRDCGALMIVDGKAPELEENLKKYVGFLSKKSKQRKH